MKNDRLPVMNHQKEWINVLKGIGILSVVVGHIVPGILSVMIYMFHMPLFFLISGYLFKSGKDQRVYFVEKIQHLIIPYFSFLLLVYIAPKIYQIVSAGEGWGAWLTLAENVVMGGRDLTGTAGVFWFVTCLFLTQQVFSYLMLHLSQKMMLVVVSVAYVLSLVNSYFNQFWLPLNANVILAALPFFYVGFVAKGFDLGRLVIPAVILAIAAVGLLGAGFDNKYHMKMAHYGLPIVTFVSSISVVVVLVALSKLIEKHVSSVKMGLVELGNASMIIMYLHLPVAMLMQHFLSVHYGIVVLIATIIPLGLFYVIKRHPLLSRFFLGAYAK